MAKTQPKIDDIKDLKKATIVSDGLMSKEDKEKLDNLDYDDLGDMPVATDTEVGGIKIGYIQGLDADLLDGNEASYFATSTHNHDGTYSTTDTKNTAGATDTSSKIYLVGSTEQSENPQTYTHDTAYVDVDGTVYSGSSKTITNSDLVTNQIVTPTLNPT